VACALLIKSHGFVVPADLTGALSAAAIKHGARLQMPARAQRVEQRREHVSIGIDNGTPVTAGHVVIAAGSWSGHLDIEGVPALPIKPIRGQLVQLASDAPALKRIVWGPRCYLVPVDTRSIFVGATVEDAGFDERTTVAGVRDLLDAACDLVPHLWQATFVGARAGLRPVTADEMPIVGRSAKIPRVVYATGHYRNGVLLAPLTARAIADLILDNREDPLMAAAAPQRFGEY
jgi:glycine oxidase